ncbi:DNA gyrase inhibitor [Dissulfuribacter thermophilus]|uniref:DNA gyrase inhibitor n=1 Tax=Dissulfuribacter thermophilus TaxID=1156395 RepID=A0A1B9F696_9BACT|nr:DNA gyrase inhibitor [Dissulfuribacter thermophilus]
MGSKCEAKNISIRCPICEAPVDFFQNPYRPFCSKRCKMVDLGAWFKEDYRIKGEPQVIEKERYKNGYPV